MKIDRERFVALVAAMAGCGGTTSSATPPVVVAAVDPSTADASAPIAVATEEPKPEVKDPRTACQRENDDGDVDCSSMRKTSFVGPACEGVLGTCDLLAQGAGYRKRAASVAAKCFARLGRQACNIQARKKCYAEGLRAACPEPEFESICEEKMAACTAKHVRPSYTKDDCMRALSGQKAGPDRDWAISAMGPSSEGKCELMFTVY